MQPDRLKLVCPACRSPLDELSCGRCRRSFPVVAGIADLRLVPDPYISLEDDRRKAEHLAAVDLPFDALVARYYAMTPEVPADDAARWTARIAQEVDMTRAVFVAAQFNPAAPFLDLGCSTGAALIAAGGGIGVDVALRWLVIARARLREAGIEATLVCANAESLPFADRSAGSLYAGDLLEHLRDVRAAAAESRRVMQPGAEALWTTNNRWSVLPEPHTGLWGAAWLPRGRQARYVASRRPGTKPYLVTLRSTSEISRMFPNATVTAAPLIAPHRPDLADALDRYNRAIRLPVIGSLAAHWGPRLWVRDHR